MISGLDEGRFLEIGLVITAKPKGERGSLGRIVCRRQIPGVIAHSPLNGEGSWLDRLHKARAEPAHGKQLWRVAAS